MPSIALYYTYNRIFPLFSFLLFSFLFFYLLSISSHATTLHYIAYYTILGLCDAVDSILPNCVSSSETSSVAFHLSHSKVMRVYVKQSRMVTLDVLLQFDSSVV